MESVSLFDWIAGLSPWWWVAFGIALGALEMATGSFFLIWPALAAIAMAINIAIGPSFSGEVIVILYAGLSIVLTFLGRFMMNRFGDGAAPETTLNQRSAQVVGRRAKVLSHEHGEGVVEIDGVRWKAVWTDTAEQPGELVRIDKADGMVLRVSNPT